MSRIAEALQSITVTLWAGGLWITGLMVAPVLFSRLEDRALAGLIAGQLFSLMAWIGIACALYLIVFRCARYGRAAFRQALLWIVLLMLLLAAAGEFGVQPVMAALKAEALPRQVMESLLRDRFATWHAVATALYLLQCLLAAVLVILLNEKITIKKQ